MKLKNESALRIVEKHESNGFYKGRKMFPGSQCSISNIEGRLPGQLGQAVQNDGEIGQRSKKWFIKKYARSR